jgi:hypothetical protein
MTKLAAAFCKFANAPKKGKKDFSHVILWFLFYGTVKREIGIAQTVSHVSQGQGL